jgi:hypothetical protein
MFCIRCKHDVVDCLCVDIEERLASLCGPEGAIEPAARANLSARLRNLEGAGKKPH